MSLPSHRALWFGLAAAVAIGVPSGCTSSAPSVPGGSSATAISSIDAPKDQRTEMPKTFALVGTVGTVPARMRLTQRGDNLTGSYRYEGSRPSVSAVVSGLDVEGKVDGKGQVTLTETTSDAPGASKKTGVFQGTLSTGPTGAARLAGRWSSAQGSPQLPFDLAEVVPTVRGARIEPVRWNEPKPVPTGTVTVEYPSIRNAPGDWASGFNRTIRDDIAKVVTGFAENVGSVRPPSGVEVALEIDYEVPVVNDDVVSVVYHVYENAGGAHPNGNVRGLVFSVESGRVVRLHDLFKPGAQYLTVLSRVCQGALPPFWQTRVDTSASPQNYENYYLTRQGITIVFPVAHVLGDVVEVYVPYAQLRDVLDPAGPAGKLMAK